MNIYISYFYQIRFFSPNMIPISTAKYDPKWFSKNGHIYLDNNGVLNGIRFPELSPNDDLSGMCCGRSNCNLSPDSCGFLKGYREQLDKLSISDFVEKVDKLKRLLESNSHIKYEDIVPVLIVYESEDNLCSERKSLMNWLRTNNINCNEWRSYEVT